MRNFIQEGRTLTVPAPAGGVVTGDMVRIGDLLGVAACTVAEGEDVAVSVEGVYELPKAADDVALGDRLYFNPADGVLTTTATNAVRAGYATAPAAAGAGTVLIKLTPGAA